MWTAGRSPRILSTSGANAAAKIRVEQSKSASSSRFSAASLRGLTGHHTAAAREIPKTQVNAVGSFAERIATLSPGRTPRRASATATRRDVSWTSAYVRDSPASSPGVVRHGASGSSDAPLSR